MLIFLRVSVYPPRTSALFLDRWQNADSGAKLEKTFQNPEGPEDMHAG